MHSGRSDDAVGHVGNEVTRNFSHDTSNAIVESNHCERGTRLFDFGNKPGKCIGGDASSFDQVHDLNKRNRGNVSWRAAGRSAVDQRKDCGRKIFRVE